MSTSMHIDKLITDFFENAKEIGRNEQQQKQAILDHDIPKVFETKIKTTDLYYTHYALKREIKEAYEIKERIKTYFERLFNR